MTESIDEVLNALDATINGKAVDDKVRVALQRYAAAGHCTFNNENDGSSKIRRSGGDNDLSDIAIVMDLGYNSSRASQESALAVFSALGDEVLPCGVALVGRVSDLGHPGHSEPSRNKPDDRWSGLKTSQPGDAIFSSYSAVLEVEQTDQEPLRIKGSRLLLSRAKKHARTSASLEMTVTNLETPFLRIQGPSAQQVAVDTIRDYSKHVAALFENFD